MNFEALTNSIQRPLGVSTEPIEGVRKKAWDQVAKYRREPDPLFLYLVFGLFIASSIVVFVSPDFAAGAGVFFFSLVGSVWLAHDRGSDFEAAVRRAIQEIESQDDNQA